MSADTLQAAIGRVRADPQAVEIVEVGSEIVLAAFAAARLATQPVLAPGVSVIEPPADFGADELAVRWTVLSADGGVFTIELEARALWKMPGLTSIEVPVRLETGEIARGRLVEQDGRFVARPWPR